MKTNWLFNASTCLVLGSSIAIFENFLSHSIDSLLPESSEIKTFTRSGTITLLSQNKEIIQKLGPATREKIEKEKIPIIIKNAFISAEDRRFYKHQGVDLWGIMRALISNIRQRDIKEGASTITQQLARIVYLNKDKSITRKIKEAALAYKIERQLSKKEILEQYLNNVYLGSSAYGVSDAAWIYFSKSIEELTLEEIALIAGLAPAPSFYSPLVNPQLALKRRYIVLERMQREGFISKDEFAKVKNSPLNLKPAAPKYITSSAPFFSSWVYTKLPEILSQEQIEIGGLTIITSLNLDWQQKAREILQKYNPKGTEGAIVSIEPNSGLVKVLVGGKDFKSNQFNRATQALRSPGSTFKIFIYAAALNDGFNPQDIFLDAPRCWYGYCPKNFGNKYLGEISLADAFKSSSNAVAVHLLDIIGFEKVISTANKLGIGKERPLGHYYPLAIGAYEETVLNMTAAYAAIANRGIYFEPNPIVEIYGPNNKVIWSKDLNNKKGERVMKRNVADTLNWMLQKTVIDGTGNAAFLPNRTVAGKTGTSEGGRDLWFIGSIPQLSTGVWFGKDNNEKTNSSSGNAAWAWKKFIQQIESDMEVLDFPLTPLKSK